MFGTILTFSVHFQGRKIFGVCSSEDLEGLEWKKSNFCYFFSGSVGQPSFPLPSS